MLLRFRVENYKALRDENQLSLVASNLSGAQVDTFIYEAGNIEILPVVAIYGANASGKTTILQALAFMQHAVVESHRSWKPDAPVRRQPFRLNDHGHIRPSLFEVDFVLDHVRYQYGFVLGPKTILEEWLFAYPRGRKQSWFTRDSEAESQFNFGRNLPGENKTIQALTRPNSLYLSAAAQNGHKALLPVYEWFAQSLTFVHSGNARERLFKASEWAQDKRMKNHLAGLLQSADLGIVGIDVSPRRRDDKKQAVLAAALAALDINSSDIQDTELEVSLRHQAEGKDDGVPLPFSAESNGTRAYFALIPEIVDALSQGGIVCIDELDASLHPNVAIDIVDVFSRKDTNPYQAQLIFNTHDTNLLSANLLRRDQVWFTEKDQSGAAHLYPLSDYRPRKDENLERGYLQGRYGAIPFLGITDQFHHHVPDNVEPTE